MEGRLIEGRGGLYTVLDESGQRHVLRAQKKLKRSGQALLVGDRLVFQPGEGETHGWIEEILPRKNELVRPPVANITRLCLVIAPAPEADWLLIDKMLVLAIRQGVQPILIANKDDMGKEAFEYADRVYSKAGIQALSVSANTGAGMDALRLQLRGEVACFAGQSGVGKSTLLSALLGVKTQTGALSEKIQRGKQTTRHATLYVQDDLFVLDTPGFSLLSQQEPQDPVLLQDVYPEFSPFRGACRFAPCYHDREPGCAVREAVREGRIHPDRYARYLDFLNEMRTVWRERYD